jgi:hypothetical protein
MTEQQPPWDAPQGYPTPGQPPQSYAQPGYAQPGYAQAGYAQPGYAPPAPRPSTVGRLALAAGLTAVVLGLLSTVLQYTAIRSGSYAAVGWVTWMAAPVCVAATVLGIVGLRQPGRDRGAAAAGLALGAAPLLSLAFSTLLFSTL